VNLYLMRHAIATEPENAIEDSLRPLTEKGCNKLDKIAHTLKKMDLQLDLILTSPSLRARQTAEALAAALNIKASNLMESTNLAPMGYGDRLVDEINAMRPIENLLLVGHEPGLSQLIGMLVAGDANLEIQMKKAGLCKLSMKKLTYARCARLEWLLTPAQLIA
jgi:phosphohistidine phosphatase